MKKTAAREVKSKAEGPALSQQKNPHHSTDQKHHFQQPVPASTEPLPQAKRWNPCDFYYY